VATPDFPCLEPKDALDRADGEDCDTTFRNIPPLRERPAREPRTETQVVTDPIEPPPDSDEDLLVRLRGGERDVFGSLVKRYERELFGYLRRYLGSDDLADDVFQNTFVQVFRKIDRYEPGRPARPWIYAVATNQAIDALRKRNRRSEQRSDASAGVDENGEPRPLLDVLEARDPNPADLADLAEQRKRVREAVDRLPEILKQVVLLAYFQGLKYKEVAEILEVPVGTVKSRLHAAIGKLGEDWPAAEKV